MAVILWAMGLSLLMPGYLFSLGKTETGCKKWFPNGDDVCCEACHRGNRLVKKCGPNPKELCKLCEIQTFKSDEKATGTCNPCRQCVGALVTVKNCTATSNTICSCKERLICGDDSCSFCTQKCGKGEEQTKDRSCRPCPDGMFSDQIHQKCKPWSTKCPHASQSIVAKGDAFTDIKCSTVPNSPSRRPIPPDTLQAWLLVLSVVASVALIGFIVIVAVKTLQKRKKTKKPITKTTIIRNPTDDPQTLIAIECSFHEAQQEQGSSQESLNSVESSEQLIAVKKNLAR